MAKKILIPGLYSDLAKSEEKERGIIITDVSKIDSDNQFDQLPTNLKKKIKNTNQTIKPKFMGFKNIFKKNG